MKSRYIPYLVLGGAIFIVDQATKRYVFNACLNMCHVGGPLSFNLMINRGISWSLLCSDNPLIFGFITALIGLITLAVAWQGYQRIGAGLAAYGQTLVVAGSCSNILDRILVGGVIDFIVLSWGNWTWPTFNIADIAIVGGVGLMLLQLLREDY